MFKRKQPYKNGLAELSKAAQEHSELRTLATRRLLRTLEKMKAEQAEKELALIQQYGRKAGAM